MRMLLSSWYKADSSIMGFYLLVLERKGGGSEHLLASVVFIKCLSLKIMVVPKWHI